MTAPPLEDGAVLISDGRIQAAGAWRDLAPHYSGPVLDLGESILFPGLVNSHCHLDYTHLAGQLAAPKTFPDWIKAILSAKAAWSFSDYATSWLAGAEQLIRSGTTSVANIEAVPELPEFCRPSTPLRVHSFFEMTGVKSRRPPEEILQETTARMGRLSLDRAGIGLSPHALYSTSPELVRHTVDARNRTGIRTTMHVAESLSEYEMYMYRHGPMYDWLESQRPMEDCGHASPVHLCHEYGLLHPSFLAVHVNYLWEDDATLLSQTGTTVVHCPQSHAYFRHHRFPRTELSDAGVNLCLGTDSLASSRPLPGRPLTLSLFDEMQMLARVDSMLTPHQILRMVTINGARALGLDGCIGSLQQGAQADLAVAPYAGQYIYAEESLVHLAEPLRATMIGGQWVFGTPGT